MIGRRARHRSKGSDQHEFVIIADNAAIAAYIRNLRKQLGETQVEFAERFGVRGQTISCWETERQRAPIIILSPLTVDIMEMLNND